MSSGRVTPGETLVPASLVEPADRLSWNNPRELVEAAAIAPGARVAEIGCGSGWFTLELEKAVRPRGMVFALDMQPSMLQILETRRQHWERILTLPCKENEFELDSGEVDVVFHANVLHECRDVPAHLAEVHRVLKPGGRFIVIEWNWASEESQPGPPNAQRLEPAEVAGWLQSAGFSLAGAQGEAQYSDAGPFHYLIQALKKSVAA